MNINTREYWERRFATGDWEANLGREQTILFAETQVRYLRIPSDFSGKILDFGCGLGDAMPVYRKAFRYASLIGMDISKVAIAECKRKYGDIAQFVHGVYTQVPEVNVIIASNVFEHLSNDIEIAKHLRTRCGDLYIVVPYKEALGAIEEHVNSYDEDHFIELGAYSYTVFMSKGWSQSGWDLWCNIYLKNLCRRCLGRKLCDPRKQIMFHFSNST